MQTEIFEMGDVNLNLNPSHTSNTYMKDELSHLVSSSR
jgi:hypothetical protein